MWEKNKIKKLETRGYGGKELLHFVDPYHQLPEEPLLKWIVKMTNLEPVSLLLDAAEWKSTFGLM